MSKSLVTCWALVRLWLQGVPGAQTSFSGKPGTLQQSGSHTVLIHKYAAPLPDPDWGIQLVLLPHPHQQKIYLPLVSQDLSAAPHLGKLGCPGGTTECLSLSWLCLKSFAITFYDSQRRVVLKISPGSFLSITLLASSSFIGINYKSNFFLRINFVTPSIQ